MVPKTVKSLFLDRVEVTNLNTNSTSVFPLMLPMTADSPSVSVDKVLQPIDYKVQALT